MCFDGWTYTMGSECVPAPGEGGSGGSADGGGGGDAAGLAEDGVEDGEPAEVLPARCVDEVGGVAGVGEEGAEGGLAGGEAEGEGPAEGGAVGDGDEAEAGLEGLLPEAGEGRPDALSVEVEGVLRVLRLRHVKTLPGDPSELCKEGGATRGGNRMQATMTLVV